MVTIHRSNSENKDFIDLVKELDADLTIRDGDKHDFYDQYNKIDKIKYVVLAYEDKIAVGCGAILEYDRITVEVKRMFTSPNNRGNGIATKILIELEKWAIDLSYEKCILETGIMMPEAIGLYTKCGYQIIPNYGQYIDASDSRCFEKFLVKDFAYISHKFRSNKLNL